jgi:hypothetical protein
LVNFRSCQPSSVANAEGCIYPDMEPVLKTGPLLIKTKGFLSRRWAVWRAVLRFSTLEWFPKNAVVTGSRPAGTVALTGCRIAESAGGKYSFAFDLVLRDGQLLQLRSESADEKDGWLAAFLCSAATNERAPQAGQEPASSTANLLTPAVTAPAAISAAMERARLLPSPADSAHPAESSSPILLAGWLGLQQPASDEAPSFIPYFFVLRASHLSAYPIDAVTSSEDTSATPPLNDQAVSGMLLRGAEVSAPAQGFPDASCTFELYYPDRDAVMVVQVG